MGGTTFEHYVSGVDVKDAFKRAHEEATYEHGHGGYSGTIAEKPDFVVITKTPLLDKEADALAQKLINDGDPRIDDKWGPAGAIPVISSTRKVAVKGFEYVHDHDHRDYSKVQPALLEAVTPLVKLKKGETIQSVSLSQYETPKSPNYRGYYGGGGYGTRSSKVTYKNCSGTVTINKPPATRKAPIVVEIPGGLDYDQRNKEIAKQVESMKLRAGEKVISWHAGEDTPGPARVTAVAPKGATATRYIVVAKNRFGKVGPVTGMGHGAWEDGFETQAEGRKWLTDVCKVEKNWVGMGPLAHLGDDATLEVESVTRRASGEPLVSVRREVGKRMVNVEVEVKLAGAGTQAQPDGWLFFGWASC